MATRDIEQAASSSSSSSSHERKYDVFLKFRGKDTRKNFTDHLYAALLRRGITAFKDDRKLKRGNTISTQILHAIQHSRVLAVIFSSNHASSTWCLDELVQISDCLTGQTQTVVPALYRVDPSEVLKQTGRFRKAFAEHEEVFRQNSEKVHGWRTATDRSGQSLWMGFAG